MEKAYPGPETLQTMKAGDVLLRVEGLRTEFRIEDGLVRAVDDVSFDLRAGETLGMVGESGSGKSVTSLSIMGLIRKPARVSGGRVLFEGEDLLTKTYDEMRRIRGNKIAMVFQEPMTSLNPLFTVGHQIAEALRVHENLSESEAAAKAVDMLNVVGIPAPEKRAKDFPHQLSGGMRQRVMIAMALACRPRLLIADEPTTALDVTVQAQILDLMQQLRAELGMSILLITHDMGVIAEMADRVAVMYAGKIVEVGAVRDIAPLHPYTQGLLASIPGLDTPRGKLHVIEGSVPNMMAPPWGCRFHPRCPEATDECATASPPLRNVRGRAVACIKYTPEEAEVRPS